METALSACSGGRGGDSGDCRLHFDVGRGVQDRAKFAGIEPSTIGRLFFTDPNDGPSDFRYASYCIVGEGLWAERRRIALYWQLQHALGRESPCMSRGGTQGRIPSLRGGEGI